MPRGGKRPNAGRKPTPAGSDRKAAKALRAEALFTKEAARAVICQRVYDDLVPLLEAQIANAAGIKYLVVRQKSSGKFLRVTEAMARVKLAEGEEIVEVWEKDPSVQAWTDLINRLIDKPKDQEQEFKLTGDDELVARLLAARRRSEA